jgi:hypothetical protein
VLPLADTQRSVDTQDHIVTDRECLHQIRYGLVARISRSQTVLSRTTRSEEAGVQFPVSESSFVFALVVVLPRCQFV